MSKWCALFLILAVAVGVYWVIMSGMWTDRLIHMERQGAMKEVSISDVITRLQRMRERADGQEALVEKLSFVARNPDWTNVRHVYRETGRLIQNASEMLEQRRDETQTEAVQSLHAQIQDMGQLTVETFYPKQRTFWTVLFWVLLVPAFFFGLLAVVRAQPL
jgi:hypothetical protein